MSWRIAGEDSFDFVILEEVDDPSTLLHAEQYWIQLHNSTERVEGYNAIRSVKKKAPTGLPRNYQKKVWPKRKFPGSGLPNKGMA